MNLFSKFQAGLPYQEFLTKHGTPQQADRWHRTFEAMRLSTAQKQVLGTFKREMNVLVLAGVWCGDCSGQCPVYERFVEVAPVIKTRYIDRDVHADAQEVLQINGGNRVPVVVFFSEDGFEVARFGERTLSKYRDMASTLEGGCPSGVTLAGDPLLNRVTQDWLNEFERVQWLLRLSPRLRARHGD